jgi:outer membrane protein assembly factor BamB
VRVHVLLAVVLVVLARGAAAEDWPQFRGPDGQGHSSERNLPTTWSETEHVVWKTPVPGAAWSSPVVAGGRVWLTTSVEQRSGRTVETSLRVLAYEVDSGREVVNVELFRVKNPGVINVKNSRASPTPVVDGDRVYIHFGADGTAAVTTAGAVVWKKTFPYVSQHGNGGSPIIYDDLLIFSCDGWSAAFVIALDKLTGKVRWKTDRREPWDQAYSTPLVIRVADRDELISPGAYRTGAYDPRTGKEIWRVSYRDGFSNVPRPVYGNGVVYLGTGLNPASLIAVRVDGTGDVTKTHVAWELQRGVPFISSPLLVGNELYFVSDGGIASCVDAKTGNYYWQSRLLGAHSASPIYADGRIYFLSEEGVTTVVAPGTTFRTIATNRLSGSTYASMAVSNGSLFIRSDTHLYRIANAAATTNQPSGQRPAAAQSPQATFDRAVGEFLAGRVTESAASFDELVTLAPATAPQLWQRGIALYYAGRYADCRAQFESHRTVNPDDVENAAWHYLCVARAQSPAAAKAALLPVGADPRVPMRQIYEMFRGTTTPDQVMAAVRGQTASAEFYAHLYVGLYSEALGNAAAALEHITAAADERFAAAGGYMHSTARIHLARLRAGK